MKIKTTLTIEQEVFEKAKKHLPNISAFVEECLKQYIGLAEGTYPTAEAKDIVDDIGKSQAKLFILNQNYNFEESQKQIEEGKLNKAWRFLWNDYKRRLVINQELMNEAVTVLNVDSETLEDILDFAYVNSESLPLNTTWKTVYELYQQEED